MKRSTGVVIDPVTAPYCITPAARPLRASDIARPSSSQPTGWPGRLVATTTPTVAALMHARVGATAKSVMNGVPSGRSNRSSVTALATGPTTATTHSPDAASGAHERERPRVVDGGRSAARGMRSSCARIVTWALRCQDAITPAMESVSLAGVIPDTRTRP